MAVVVKKTKKSRSALFSSCSSSCCDSITVLSVALIVGALCLRILILDPASSRSSSVEIPKEPPRNFIRTKTDVSSYKSLIVDVKQYQNDNNLFFQHQSSHHLAINPTSSLASDIVSIQHVPKESSIVVSMKRNGRCPNPYFRGRLSGPAIVLLEWGQQSTTTTTTTTTNTKGGDGHHQLYGYYRVPISGTYYVEIIAIVCNNFSNDMEYDFSTTCVEDPANHRITKTNVKIHVDININNNKSPQLPQLLTGYWFHQQDERARNNDYTALYTRYQPRGCLRLNDPTHEHFHMPPKHCIEPTNWNRFEPYNSFQYYYDYHNDGSPTPNLRIVAHDELKFLRNAKEIQAPSTTTICLVGGSHSRTLKASMVNHHNFTIYNNNLRIEWINAKFPRNVNNKTILEQIVPQQCNQIILAVGQWPASFSGNSPTKFQTYQMEMTKLLHRLSHHLSAAAAATTTAHSTIEIWTRSIHENPLNERIAAYCPPKDWRSPTVLDGYNTIIRQATRKANEAAATAHAGNTRISIRFVDTSFIVSPLWDCSTDWGHVCPQPSHVEALYLVAVVMGLIELPNT